MEFLFILSLVPSVVGFLIGWKYGRKLGLLRTARKR
jgi:hypothetical protein